MKGVIPTVPEVLREAIIVMAGALLAALILSRLPTVRDYIKANTALGGAGCNCDGAQARTAP